MAPFPWDTYLVLEESMFCSFYPMTLNKIFFWHMHLRGRLQHVPFTTEYFKFISAPFTVAKKYLEL